MAFSGAEKQRLLLLVLAVILVLASLPWLLSAYRLAEAFIRASSLLGPILYMVFMIGAILIAPLPASPLAILAGQVFGPWRGMLYTLVAATLGALIAFTIARFFLNELARNHLKSYTWYKKIENTDEYSIAYMIALTRLMPQISFDLISYAAGLTKIRASFFTLATFIGMIPIVFVLSFFGYLLQPYQELMLLVFLGLFLIYIIYKKIKK